MNIEFTPPERIVDLQAAMVSAMKAAANIYAPNSFGAAGEFGELMKHLHGTKSTTPENLAWIWLSKTVTLATRLFVDDLRRKYLLVGGDVDAAIGEFVTKCMAIDETCRFDSSALWQPSAHSAFEPARHALLPLIFALTTITRFDEEKGTESHWQQEFDCCLNRASAYVLSSDHERLMPLLNVATGPGSEAMQRDLAWARHYNWIHRKVDTAPVFSPDETVSTPLKDLYLRLRCFWHRELPIDKVDTTNPRWIAHVGDLHETTKAWLSSKGSTEHLRLVTGGPGSGKSSFARVFASEAILRATHRVLFVELQHMPHMSGDLEADIARYFTRRDSSNGTAGGAGFPEDPLSWLRHDSKPVLLVFDGLDDLSFNDDNAVEINRKFIENTQSFLSRLNSDGVASKALILGRNQSVQSGMHEAELPVHTLLNVAPIREISEKDLEVAESRQRQFLGNRCQYPDLKALPPNLTEDQRPGYWKNWARSQSISVEMPEAVTHPDLLDLNVEPLLLHLLILSDYCGDRWREAADNRNCVYEDILTKIHGRNSGEKTSTRKSVEWYFCLMEALGLAAWRGNQSAGSEADFIAVRDVHAEHLIEDSPLPDSAKLKNVVLQTHARRIEPIEAEGAGFEFIHKSFGEYLAARGLITASERWHKQSIGEDGPAVDQIAQKWAGLVGDAELTPEIVRFLYDEARLRGARNTFGLQTIETLNRILQWVTLYGMPVHWLEGSRNFLQMEKCNRSGTGALLAAASAWALASDDAGVMVRPNWPSNEAIRALERLYATHLGESRRVLAKLDLSGANLSGADLRRADLRRADLSGANLSGANLSGADLSGAGLRKANLSGADLSGGDLRRAKLLGADLRSAKLNGADLHEADLRSARLNGADLRGAKRLGVNLLGVKLRGANLLGVNLSGADLRRADLSGADLNGANLHEADLYKANLSGAKFLGADLRRADLSGANLLRADLLGADLYKANLSGAKFLGANLLRADLSRADLSGADLSGAKLQSTNLTRCKYAVTRVRLVDFTTTLGLAPSDVQSLFGVKAGFGRTMLPEDIPYPDHWYVAEDADKESMELLGAFEGAFESWCEGQH